MFGGLIKYLNKAGFSTMKRTHEQVAKEKQHALCLQNLDQYWDERGLVKWFKKNGMVGESGVPDIQGIQKNKQKTFAFLTFASEDECALFRQVVGERKLLHRKRVVQVKETGEGRFVKCKRFKAVEEEVERAQTERVVVQPKEEDIERVKQMQVWQQVSPLLYTPYAEQVASKKTALEKVLKRIEHQVQSQGCSAGRMEIAGFYEAEEGGRRHYRNKAEMTVGLDQHGRVQVGFNKGEQAKGVLFVESVSQEDTGALVSPECQVLAEVVRQQVQEEGQSLVYDRFSGTGFYRNITVRQSARSGQVLVNIVVSPMEDRERQTGMLQQLAEKMVGAPLSPGYKVHAIVGVENSENSESVPALPVSHQLYGPGNSYSETLLGCAFQVHAQAFLQVNTQMCEVLYQVLASLSLDGLTAKKLVFLDICSGTGTIGICLYKLLQDIREKSPEHPWAQIEISKIIAIEMVKEACEGAVENAQINGIPAEKYHCVQSKVEECIQREVAALGTGATVVGLVDPPRSGLHASVVTALRTCRGLDRLVYVSCNAQGSLTDNLLMLCLPQNKKRRAPQFKVAKVLQFDLFPQTVHYETVVLLQRWYEGLEESEQVE